MILDYFYSQKKKQFAISYVTEQGGKKLLKYNVARFKSYKEDLNGKFVNWNGKKCSPCYVERPSWAEYKNFLEELPEKEKKLLSGKTTPRLYTFDIEVAYDPNVFPEPDKAEFPIQTISVVNDQLDAVVLGTKQMSREEELLTCQRYHHWLGGSDFFKNLNIKLPRFQYIYFETESAMVEYFLKNIVAKAPAIAGWNSLGFDWMYIENRCKNYLPDIIFPCCSMDWTMDRQRVYDFRNQSHYISIPSHTLVLDMMDVIGSFDMAVMPIKENLSLDYIASNSIGMSKIKYEGDLQELYNRDYGTYVFYNMIDSVLVQMIDKRFKTLEILYTQSYMCRNKATTSFSKIAITESMFFNYFFENGIKVVPSGKDSRERGSLVGAYVRTPTPGKHMYVCCNDFASLYPSVIVTCNLSIENFLGTEGIEFTKEQTDKYRKDPNYFVSVNGNVYKNDKDYSFKIIQRNLKALRGQTKYTSKQLDATLMSDLEHIKDGVDIKNQTYKDNCVQAIKALGYDITCTNDLRSIDLNEFERKMRFEINFMTCTEQAIKLIMNSMYGGSSHVYFEWFNMSLANDITGEGRNLIHIMEDHIPNFFQENWYKLKDLHKTLGIELLSHKIDETLALPVAGDTDSIYFCYNGLLNTIKGVNKLSITEKARILVDLNEKFLNQHNKQVMIDYYKTRNIRNPETDMIHEFELETIAYSEIRLDVKKRYSQMLIFKDGKMFDEDHMKAKTKGLEMIKSSFPAPARKILKGLVETLLLTEDENLIHILNKEMQQGKISWFNDDLQNIVPSITCNNYDKYIKSDDGPYGYEFEKGAPFQIKGLAYYNWLRQHYNLPGDPVYGGKLKYYIVKQYNKRKNDPDLIFTYPPDNYPAWAEEKAPIDKLAMFNKYVLDPMNRILSAIKMPELSASGMLSAPSLFGDDF